VLTGGEPLLQIDGIIELLNELNYGVNYVEIETNGTIPYNDDLMLQSCLDIITISPKRELKSGKYLVHSAWFEYSHISPEIIWKFVVSNEEDVKEVKRFVDENDLIESNVYLMPKVIKSEEHNDLLRKVAEWGLKYNFNISPRLQIALWGNVKGR
jgi:organic radical activating enzyme